MCTLQKNKLFFFFFKLKLYIIGSPFQKLYPLRLSGGSYFLPASQPHDVETLTGQQESRSIPLKKSENNIPT